jgi:hypothetical protein
MLIFDFLKFDLINKVEGSYSFGLGIVIGFLLWIPYILYGVLAIWTVCYAFKKSEVKRWKAFIPMTLMIITIVLFVFLPYSKTYIELNYSFNKERFQKTVQLMNNGVMQRYQIGTNKYIAPYRVTSYSGVLYTDVNDGVTKIMFYAFSGLKKDVVIVYCSDDSGIDQRDFSGSIYDAMWNYSNTKKIDVNWYSAIINGYKTDIE